MNRTLFISIIALLSCTITSCSSSTNNRTSAYGEFHTMPEEVGKYLSGLLIQRGDIKETPLSFSLEELLNGNSLADFEDSPAMFILAAMYGQQIFAQQKWDNLLVQADRFGINKNTVPFKTYFIQFAKDEFSLLCILASSSNYYCFTATIRMKDENSPLIWKMDDELKEYKDLSLLEKDWLDINTFAAYFLHNEFQIKEEDIENQAQKDYSYNPSPVLPDLKNQNLLSPDLFVESLTRVIENKDVEGINRISFSNDNTQNKENWTEIIALLKEKQIESFEVITNLSNIPIKSSTAGYNARITYLFQFENEEDNYSFSCDIALEEKTWKVTEISGIHKEESLKSFSF